MGFLAAAEPLPACLQLDPAKRSLETTAEPGHAVHISEPRYGSPDYDDHAPILPGESVFRHSGWSSKRRKVLASLRRTGASQRRVLNFCDCGSDLWVKRDGTELVLTCNRCHDRMCDPCQRERRGEVIEKIMLRVIDCPAPCRFITLTLKHQAVPLSQQIDRLLACFKLLRQHPAMKPLLQGGVWFFEGKLAKDGKLWHPHLHVIAAAEYISPRDLSRAWLEVTGDSFIVDVDVIHDRRRQANYVTKYTTKPADASVLRDPARLDEFVVAIKGRRLYQCFGTWSKAQPKAPATKRQLQLVDSLVTIHANALRGDIQALVLMHQLHAKWPRLRKSHPLPDDIPPQECDPP